MNLKEWKEGEYILKAAIKEINDIKIKEEELIDDDYKDAMIKWDTTENDMSKPFV